MTDVEVMNKVSEELRGTAEVIGTVLHAFKGGPVDWFMLVHTYPYVSYIGSPQGMVDAPGALEHLRDRWAGDIHPVPPEPTKLYTRLRPSLKDFAQKIHNHFVNMVGDAGVGFSLVIYDPPHPVLWVSTACREDVVKQFETVIPALKEGKQIAAHRIMAH